MRSRWYLVITRVALVLACAGVSHAQFLEDVFPLEPEDGATSGPRIRFRIGIDGTDVMKMQFRIELSRDRFDTVAYTFDQREDPKGWGWVTHGFDDKGGVYLNSEPLEHGAYEWKAWAWNGVDWVEGDTTFRLVVDTVPPAEVSGLRLKRTAEGGVALTWDPVWSDENGDAETVASYHVFRYFRRAFFDTIRPNVVATVEDTRWEDADPLALAAGLVVYDVIAEDVAGNHIQRMPGKTLLPRDRR